MTWMILGLVLWTGAHMFKRVAPGPRQSLQEQMGDGSKGVFAALLLLSVVLMVIGYRGVDGTYFWGRSAATVGVNNLLMLVAVALYGVGNSQSRLRGKMRHPMLLGTVIWAVAHLLVNGDTASLILFGWIAIWALAEILLINRSEPEWVAFEGGSVAGDVRLGVITLIVYAVIGFIHAWLGYNPFGA